MLARSKINNDLDGKNFFQVDFKTIEGYAPLLNRKTEGINYEFILSSTICIPPTFSKHSHHSIPINMLEDLQQGRVMSAIDQVCFFHTSSQSISSLLIVVELIAMPTGSNSIPFTLGWGVASFSQQKMDNISLKARVPLNEGTPRMIFTTKGYDISKDVPSLTSISGCIITFSFSLHPTLSKATHLIPENVLVAFDDIIPGLVHTNIPEAFPKISKIRPLSVEKLGLYLVPSVDVFDNNLISLLKEDIDSTHITIEERRLKFLPYNGWTCTTPPSVVHLSKSTTDGRSSTMSHSFLVFRGSLELFSVPPHILTEVIVQLEYVLKLTRDGINQGFAPSSDTITLTLCWGVWLPFNKEITLSSLQREAISIELKRGPGYDTAVLPNSAYKTCYEGNLIDVGRLKLSLSATDGLKDGSQLITINNITESDGHSIIDSRSQLFQSERTDSRQYQSERTDSRQYQSGIEAADSGVTLDKDCELGQPVCMSTPRSSVKQTSATPEHVPLPTRIHTVEHAVAMMGTKLWVEPTSRSLLSHFYSSGVPELTGPKGDPLTYLDIARLDSNATTVPATDLDSVIGHHIIIQLMGIEFISNPPPCETLFPSFSPLTVTINYQLLHDTPVTTCLHIIKPSDGSLPSLLSVEKCSTPGIKFTHVMKSDPSINDKLTIARYFQSSKVMLSIFNGDSGIIMGTVAFPLQILCGLLPNNDNFHVPVCLPIVHNDTTDITISTEPLADGGSAVTIGQLYMSVGVMSSSKIFSLQSQVDTSIRTNNVTKSVISYPVMEKSVADASQAKQRKIARMEAIRLQTATVPLSSTVNNESDRTAQQEKHNTISSVLLHSLSSSITLSTRIGECVYFEHDFCNSSNKSSSVVIQWEDADLRLITSMEEVVYLRKHFKCFKAIDDPTLLSGSGCGQYKMYLSQKETVKLPFKYLRQMNSDQQMTTANGHHNRKATIKVKFSDSSNDTLLSVLILEVTLLQQRVDRIFHVYHNEGMFMRKEIPVPLSVAYCNDGDLTAVCNDVNATCGLKQYQDNSGLTVVNIKVPVNKSPIDTELLIFLYNDPFMVSPIEVWKLYIHSVQRLEHSLVIGQSSVLPLNIRGDCMNRKISYHTHLSNGVKAITPSSHLINAHSLTEVLITLKSLVVGTSLLIISAKDVITGDLLMMWSVDIIAVRPTISRAFTVSLPVGEKQIEKTISWTNPYVKRKKFYLSSTYPDLVGFSSDSLKLHPSETVQVSIIFQPLITPLTKEIIIFISNKNDLIEECFLIKVIYG